MEFEMYREYLVSYWLKEYEAEHSTRDLVVAGWNMLLDEVFSPLIEKELGMRYLGNRIWAGEYIGHRRKVLSLFQPNDLGGSFKWGWNYDFVPKMSGGRAVYARTDKSIFTHFYENVHGDHKITEEPFCHMEFDRCYIDIADFENSMNQKVKEYENAFYLALPLIRSFYDETETYEQTIKMINIFLENIYYFMIQGDSLYVTKLFLQQYIGIGDENEERLGALFNNKGTRESFLKKFAKIPKDF